MESCVYYRSHKRIVNKWPHGIGQHLMKFYIKFLPSDTRFASGSPSGKSCDKITCLWNWNLQHAVLKQVYFKWTCFRLRDQCLTITLLLQAAQHSQWCTKTNHRPWTGVNGLIFLVWQTLHVDCVAFTILAGIHWLETSEDCWMLWSKCIAYTSHNL